MSTIFPFFFFVSLPFPQIYATTSVFTAFFVTYKRYVRCAYPWTIRLRDISSRRVYRPRSSQTFVKRLVGFEIGLYKMAIVHRLPTEFDFPPATSMTCSRGGKTDTWKTTQRREKNPIRFELFWPRIEEIRCYNTFFFHGNKMYAKRYKKIRRGGDVVQRSCEK